ncbi:LysR family transcriptional regulator [Agrobacterium tumefaciens]|uniref:LysR family transcriptional regulator n=1 Tax=Agrobacterium tumefaciens TaxID=358 RepID=UPI0015737132|nr:LysR substrate-binding domain-containing protein [Agrobacterium tumefaciens]NSX89168.1 LysR family transcriptional regulator [Agrobacterium tumefaciens]
MNARQLEIFRAIMRDGSVTAAANSLGISQPAASKVLHHLESQLGYKLFERIGGRLIPTMEAHLIYEDADRVFRELEVLKHLTRTISERKLGLLRIGASPPITYSIIPQALLEFRRRHPTVKVHLHALPKKEVAEQLIIGDIDLALTLSSIQAPTIRSEILSAVPVMAVMRKDDSLASLDRVTPADLSGRSLISYDNNALIGLQIEEAFKECGQTRDLAIHLSSSVGAIPLVSGGLGVALVDGLVRWNDFPGLIARPFEPAINMNLAVSINSARPTSRFFKPFMEALRNALQKQMRQSA